MTERFLTTELYDGVSDLGLFRADLSWWIGVVIGAFMAVVGLLMMISNDDDDYLVVPGIVVVPSCKEYNSDGKLTYKCNTGVQYKLGDKEYKATLFTTGDGDYVMNQPVDLKVMKKNHQEVSFNSSTSKQTGMYMVGGAGLIVGLVYLNRYIAQKYKPYAMAQGVRTMLGFI